MAPKKKAIGKKKKGVKSVPSTFVMPDMDELLTRMHPAQAGLNTAATRCLLTVHLCTLSSSCALAGHGVP
jgi:hypothetical protein